MAWKRALFLAVLFVFPTVSQARWGRYPKMQAGIQGGVFRISVDRFDEYYRNRFAFPVGFHLGYAFSPSFYAVFRGRHFQKSHKSADKATGRLRNRLWQEDWLELGIQQYSLSFSGTSRTFFGFGLAFFTVQEKKDGDFLQSLGYNSRRTNPRGFYICGGFDYLVSDRTTLSFEIELTSAGVGKGAGLQAQSVGGIFVNLGVNFLLF